MHTHYYVVERLIAMTPDISIINIFVSPRPVICVSIVMVTRNCTCALLAVTIIVHYITIKNRIIHFCVVNKVEDKDKILSRSNFFHLNDCVTENLKK